MKYDDDDDDEKDFHEISLTMFGILNLDWERAQEGPKSGSRRNVRLLKANYIKEFSLLAKAEDPLDPTKCFLDLPSIQAREEAAIR